MLAPNIESRVREWLTDDYDQQTRAEIEALLVAENWPELEDRFYRNLEFGTGGLRGIIGAGANRMNRYTLSQATQGLANYVLTQVAESAKPKAAIAHDRHDDLRVR